jgi:serine protease AprX
MVRSSLFLIFFLGAAFFSLAQQQTYFVKFKDKKGSPFSVHSPKKFLSEKAIARRYKNHVVLSETDIPVLQTYIDQVALEGAVVLYPLRWFNGVVVQSDISVKAQLANLSFVQSVGETIKLRTSNKIAVQALARETSVVADFGGAAVQNNMLGLDVMSNYGYTGKGVFVAITDDGFLNVDTNPGFARLFLQNKIIDTWDIVDSDKTVYADGGGHGAEVFSIIAGELPGQFLAPATGAKFLLFRTEDVSSESPLEELNWVRAAEIADSAGVDIIQVSLGYNTFDNSALDYSWSDLDGNTSYISRGATLAVSKGLIVVASAGNEGASPWRKVLCPADVSGVVSVGGVDYSGARASFSSTGNTADGRLKPDVMAMGLGVAYIETNKTVNSGAGTSFASPLITSFLAGLMEAYPTLESIYLVEALKKSSNRYTTPTIYYGLGIPNFSKALDYARVFDDKASIAVFPNPFFNELNLKLPAVYVGETVNWELFTVQGKNVTQGTAEVDEVVVPLWLRAEDMSAGVYVLHVSVSGELFTFRIIK